MDPETRQRLLEVFGDPTNVSPGGTGAVLTTPSKLDFDMASKALNEVPLDRILRDLGAIVAREFADDLERRGLKPSNYAMLEGLADRFASRISKVIAKSEVFEASFQEHLGLRGG